jgi:hypothetical protein
VYTAPPQPTSLLLQKLPDAELDLVLQQLDQCSLACAAVTCHKLRLAAPAAASQVAVRLTTPHTFQSFSWWGERHKSRLVSLRQCSIAGKSFTVGAHHHEPEPTVLWELPRACPQLRTLQLQDCQLQRLERSLQVCSGLTALDLQCCRFLDNPMAAFISALPLLQKLKVSGNCDMHMRTQLQLPSQLTYLSLDFDPVKGRMP